MGATWQPHGASKDKMLRCSAVAKVFVDEWTCIACRNCRGLGNRVASGCGQSTVVRVGTTYGNRVVSTSGCCYKCGRLIW